VFAEDLATFFDEDELAVEATFGVDTASVMFRAVDAELLDGAAQSTEYEATMQTTTFASLARGSSITIDGAAYTVRKVQRIGDGALKRATLTKT
jgi:hypothetical protein